MTSTESRPAVRIEHAEDEKIYSTAGRGQTFGEILARRLSRRDGLKGLAAASAITLAGSGMGARFTSAQGGTPAADGTGISFEAIANGVGNEAVVAAGYQVRPLLVWGDPLFADSPKFDVMAQTAAAQAKQVGYNCDFTGFIPLPVGSGNSDHGLLVVNHEYTNGELMFPDYTTVGPPAEGETDPTITFKPTKELVDVELEAHGMSVVEIKRDDQGQWSVVLDGKYNRRITATTEIDLTGPAAGTDLVRTSADPDGKTVIGTLNNCAGGVTPWGTVVSGEENFNQYFANASLLDPESIQALSAARYGVNEEASERQWESFYDRFDLAKEPNEPFRFGWAVEIDPLDPKSTPKKRTALGRNKHEGHTSVAVDGKPVAIYGGDDQAFDYAYKFVTAGSYSASDRKANLDLLDDGTLHVAIFNEDGTGEWVPLVQGQGELTEANGFATQADILVNTRLAADAVGATKMDRCEDFETNPVTGKVYLVCTYNNNRGVEDNYGIDAANPRAPNKYGHVIEITEMDNDHTSTSFEWALFITAGPADDQTTDYAGFDKSLVSAFSAPDNVTFDNLGNVWISTDGNKVDDANDGLFAVPTEGEERGFARRFFQVPDGAECSGPSFTPDNSSLFISVQHPGEGGYFEEQVNTWPDNKNGVAPRPSVVVVTRTDDPTKAIVGS
jgi:secreted PhoX family phosphatase